MSWEEVIKKDSTMSPEVKEVLDKLKEQYMEMETKRLNALPLDARTKSHFNKKEYLEDLAKKFIDRLKKLHSKGQWDGTLNEEGQMEVTVEWDDEK
tara:strand:+ start:3917 stop:4204 length:288 start_codon:yes stop_codon:yes gene_type:complete